MENNIFNFPRFFRLLKKDLLENWKRNLVFIIAGYGIMALVFTWNGYIHCLAGRDAAYTNINLLILVCVLFLVLGVLYSSTFMEPMNRKTKRLAYLMTPASSLEKYFSRWILVTLFYGIIFFLLVFLADATRVLVCSLRFPTADVQFINWNILIGPNDGILSNSYIFPDSKNFMIGLFFFLFVQSVFILGSTIWEKNSFVKTFAAILILTIGYLLICYGVITLLFTDMSDFSHHFSRAFFLREETQAGVLLLLGALFNWVLAYFRLKESEVIKRW